MKPHYPILDGLRGTAAVLVVIYHLVEALFLGDTAGHPMRHGYLAVDFFYLLSGFVVGYAYDDRWGRMSIKDFFKIRLTRLHPLVVLGVILGLIGFCVDKYTPSAQHIVVGKLLLTFVVSLTLLPSPDIRGWGETHSLDGPCWSLLQEYIANFIYALFGRKMTKPVLWVIVITGAIALTITCCRLGDIGTGWGYDTFWIAVVRMWYPFFAGLLLYRAGKLIRVPNAYAVCSLLLIALFFMPTGKFSGIYEALCIIFAFPAVVSMGAGGQVSGWLARLCKFSGDISYPIYITHYPFIYIYTAWVTEKKPATAQIVPVACGLFVLFIVVAWAAYTLYDLPVRAWLKRVWLKQ